MGVPVKPKKKALGSAVRMRAPSSPSCAQLAFLRPVGFIDEDDDVLPLVEDAFRLAELVNRCDEDVTGVLAQEAFQFYP